jgi:hypothetical protein
MRNHSKLIRGKKYRVVKPFTDYDGWVHHIGENWIFVETNFLPYDSGLTLHVLKDGTQVVYRLQWLEDEQAFIIENFKEFVEMC